MTLRLGASPTSPGVVCRWRRECCGEHLTLWRGDEPIGAVLRDGGPWGAFGDTDQVPASEWPHRWQAKRAVEVMASEWLRAQPVGAFADPLDELPFETREDVERELGEVESALAVRFGVPKSDVRQRLTDLDRANELVEDDVVARWHELLSRARTWALIPAVEW